jgi:hypothetical protein
MRDMPSFERPYVNEVKKKSPWGSSAKVRRGIWRKTRHEWSYLNALATSALVASMPMQWRRHYAVRTCTAGPICSAYDKASPSQRGFQITCIFARKMGALAAVVRRRYGQFE